MPIEHPFSSILKYQVTSSSKYALDPYCEPLYWYIKLCCKRTSLKMQDIADRLYIDSGLLTKKLNINNTQHRELTADDIEKICAILDTSLLSILYYYENKKIFENSRDIFDKLTKLKSIGFEKILNNSAFLDNSNALPLSNSSTMPLSPLKQGPLLNIDDPKVMPWNGKWYFYFSSSDSSIVHNRKKNYVKCDPVDFEDSEKKELYDLYSNDHIYSGTITLTYDVKTSQYVAQLKYLTNPQTAHILQYDGTATLSPSKHAIFATLTNSNDEDSIYLIIDNLFLESNFKYIMASVLTLSKNKNKWHRRPCSLRLIMSREIIVPSTRSYNIMTSNLMMNDSIIRIDDHGYGELKKLQSHYACPALDRFLEMYPDINTMDESSNYITVHNCAYISETLIKNLKNIDPKDALYLEAILRLHSIAPWYSKAKAVKTNEVLKKYESDNPQ